MLIAGIGLLLVTLSAQIDLVNASVFSQGADDITVPRRSGDRPETPTPPEQGYQILDPTAVNSEKEDPLFPGGSADSPYAPNFSNTLFDELNLNRSFSETGLPSTQLQTAGIQNGNFDLGPNADWTQFSSGEFPLIVTGDDLPFSPFSGNYMAYLGG
ncbi:MAG: hypothetical protein AAF633_23415, partial [Chloroflexota bacterium]